MSPSIAPLLLAALLPGAAGAATPPHVHAAHVRPPHPPGHGAPHPRTQPPRRHHGRVPFRPLVVLPGAVVGPAASVADPAPRPKPTATAVYETFSTIKN